MKEDLTTVSKIPFIFNVYFRVLEQVLNITQKRGQSGSDLSWHK